MNFHTYRISISIKCYNQHNNTYGRATQQFVSTLSVGCVQFSYLLISLKIYALGCITLSEKQSNKKEGKRQRENTFIGIFPVRDDRDRCGRNDLSIDNCPLENGGLYIFCFFIFFAASSCMRACLSRGRFIAFLAFINASRPRTGNRRASTLTKPEAFFAC